MFHDPIRTAPLVQDISDINLRLRVQRADSALFATVSGVSMATA